MRTAAAGLVLAFLAGPLCRGLDPERKPWHYGMTQWQDSEGLPRNTVHAVAQTLDGYIWLGTEGGLARFNGREFAVFSRTTHPAMPNNGVVTLAAGPDGELWIGTRSGLVRYHNGRLERVETGLWPPETGIRQIQCDAAGQIWVAAGRGVALRKDGRWAYVFSDDSGLKPSAVRSLSVRGGEVWVGSTTGVDLFHGQRRIQLPGGIPPDTVRAVLRDSTGRVWIGTENRGLYVIEAGRTRRIGPREGFAPISVRVMAEDRDGNVWIGTVGGGLCRYSQGRFDWLTTRQGLGSDHIRALFEDREGNLWIGTEAGGVTRLRNGRVSTMTTLDGLGSDFIRAVYEGRGGRLYAGTEGAGLYEYRGGRFSLVGALGMPSAFVTSILEDRAGNLWVGTEGDGVFRIGPSGRQRYSSASGIPENSAWGLQEDKAGVVWIATSNGLIRVEDGRASSLRAPQGLRENSLRGIHAAGDGSLWIAFRSWGLQRLRNGKFEDIALPREASHATVNAFHEDASGRIWMASNAGLLLWERGVARLIGPDHGLPSEYLCSVVEDAAGRLWMSGVRGIFAAPKAELLRAARGESKSVSGVTLTAADGMRSSECSGDAQPCGIVAKTGELWFSTLRGLVRVPPGKPGPNVHPPPVVIERVEVNGRPADSTRRVASPPGNRLLAVEFAALTFRAPEKVRYRYKLEGVDRDWVLADESAQARYHNLPPGKRRFLVMAANEDGVWSERPSEVMVDVTPYFFQRGWFYALCALTSVLIAYAAHWARTRSLRREFAAVLKERARIAREIHDTLLQGFAGAALQLNAVLRRLHKDPERAGQELEQVLEQIDGCLMEARSEIVELRASDGRPEPFETRLRRVLDAAGPNLEVRCTVEGSLSGLGPEAEKNLIRIAQEAVTNASRHARARSVQVDVRFRRDAVLLAAADDGAGMNGGAEAAGHFGIAGMRERAKLLGGRFQLTSAPAQGTRIEVEIPLRGRR